MFSKRARVQAYKRVEVGNYSFQSKLEAALYKQLKVEEDAGEIVIEKVQDHVLLSKAQIKYIADFRIRHIATDQIIHVEAKGFENERWPIIKKLWKHYGPNALMIYKGTYKKLRLDEVIEPKGEE